MIDFDLFDDDWYPTEELLAAIKDWHYEKGYLNLIELCKDAWNDCGSVEISAPEGPSSVVCKFVTGGWSGNEDIIGALMENHIFWMLCWQESKRGGVHTFKVKGPNNDKN